ncbi:hypothetical protein GF366_02225 [Candidatus Peregrinibacteria bacterium]|nr:hypothetical protein [Candidatus Peregrinibacteria bacterium]
MALNESSVVTSIDDLVEYYKKSGTGKHLYVGIEWERSGIYRDTIEPVTYESDKGYLAILKKLVAEVGWEIVEGYRNYIYELKRGNARVTLEADGRFELSGSPLESLHDLGREFRIHANEVQEMSSFFNIGWLPLGIQPFHSADEIKYIKKKRYKIFEIFAQNEWMEPQMKKNNGLTANLSYSDEGNAIKKAQTLFRIIPIVGAIFASSPINNREFSGLLDMRRYIIMHFDPLRNTIPKNILSENFSFREWIEFYSKFPVYLIKRKKKEDLIPKDLTFEKWIKEGYENIYPTIYDFDQHIKTTWSDIRLRPDYLEYRVADSVPLRMVMAVPALIKGLLFDSSNWESVKELTKDWTYEDIIETDRRAWKEGLKTEIKGKNLLWYAKALIHIANESLHKFGRKSSIGDDKDESIHLANLKEQIYIKEKSPAEEMTDLWEKEWDKNPKKLLEWCEKE